MRFIGEETGGRGADDAVGWKFAPAWDTDVEAEESIKGRRKGGGRKKEWRCARLVEEHDGAISLEVPDEHGWSF